MKYSFEWGLMINKSWIVKKRGVVSGRWGNILSRGIELAHGHGSYWAVCLGGLIWSCPSRGTVDISGIIGWIVFCCEGLSWHCRMFVSVPVLSTSH